MRPGAREPRGRGFTLLESLVAGAIFFIAVVAISLLAVQGANNASRGMRYAQAARVATQEMERYSMLGYTGLQTAHRGRLALEPPGVPHAEQVTETAPDHGRIYRSRSPSPIPPGPPVAPPPAAPAAAGGGVTVPSYYISVQVTSTTPNPASPVTVSQATYVSPN